MDEKKCFQVCIIVGIICFLFGLFVMMAANTPVFKFQQEIEKNFITRIKAGDITEEKTPGEMLGTLFLNDQILLKAIMASHPEIDWVEALKGN